MEPLTLGSSVRLDLVFSVPPPSVLPDIKCWIFDRLEEAWKKGSVSHHGAVLCNVELCVGYTRCWKRGREQHWEALDRDRPAKVVIPRMLVT